ncbi:hypothetical protein CC78DRAFT_528707 [Lojkania enalia]|uniref:Uncharacterized protein n=1 Tax=Lojkania enalia TaxID=147567 RepID=A0A9P4NBQ9_9PLEO|nr:hypothetical protein CC78DRAFT_528707 [Didymosphaeria enalia]
MPRFQNTRIAIGRMGWVCVLVNVPASVRDIPVRQQTAPHPASPKPLQTAKTKLVQPQKSHQL